MRISFISTITPYHENFHGTSALPYHLMAERPNDVEIEIYSFNNNELPKDKIRLTEKKLHVKINIIPLPWWYKFLLKLRLLFIRIFLKYPLGHYITVPSSTVEKIKNNNPDGIWVYGEELSKIVRQFDGFNRIHTFPDSEALYYYRMIATKFVVNDWNKYLRCSIMYPKYRHLERDMERDESIHYHLVGKADAEFLRDMAPGIQAHFIRHPHYDVYPQKGERHFHKPIRLLIAGQYNYYMKQDADEFINQLLYCDSTTKEKLQGAYQITFLGRGWESHTANLKADNWNVIHIPFAPNYIEEIVKHDIQFSPISIGTGTKGKVLDALANGLLVIGTPYAMENIAVENGKSCLIYHSSIDAFEMLERIALNPKQYEVIAGEGRVSVLKEHDKAETFQKLYKML